MDKGLHLDRVRITRGSQELIAIDRSISPGEILTIMGPSGVGKSTLLSAVTGSLAAGFALFGNIRLNGRLLNNLPPQTRGVGILFQDALLFPHLSVGANLGFGLAQGETRSQRHARVMAALDEVGLNGFYDRDPATLSGGQRARVALMRMLLSNPMALLLDEPFSGLDQTLRSHVRDLVFEHAKSRGLPILMVTHDSEDAIAAGGEIHKL